MRLTASIALAVAMLFVALPSQAQTYAPGSPVCMKIYSGGPMGGGEWNDCSYGSMNQCRALASGRSATCMINPYGSLAQRPAYAPRRAYKRARTVYQ
jgi:hypothetical protein